jgi:hypothetical protein
VPLPSNNNGRHPGNCPSGQNIDTIQDGSQPIRHVARAQSFGSPIDHDTGNLTIKKLFLIRTN